MRASGDRLLVLDLDGTVLVGDEPVRAYLRALVEAGAVPGSAAGELEEHLAHGGADVDGYAVVTRLAAASGAPEAVRRRAYAESRAALHDGRVTAAASEGLPALLAARPAGVVCALVTNAPAAGLAPLLDRLGLAGCFDAVIGDAGKPAGMPTLLRGLLAEHGVAPERLLAVGDIWANDCAAAADLGGATALIDRFGRGDGAPTTRAATLPRLHPAITAWWSAPAAGAPQD